MIKLKFTDMKKQSKLGIWIALASIFMIAFQIPVLAQDSLPAASSRVASWMQRNWLWIAGAILLIILLAATSTSRSRIRKTTTTVEKDDLGTSGHAGTVHDVLQNGHVSAAAVEPDCRVAKSGKMIVPYLHLINRVA